MPVPFRPLLAAALAACMAALLAASPAARADETKGDTTGQQAAPESGQAADPATVLATVNGTEITLGHVIALRAELPPQYDQFPPAMLFQGILDQLIQQTLLMQSFEGELSRQSEILLENERRAVIAGEAISEVLDEGIDEAAIRDAYDTEYPADADETEYHAAHILVGTEEEAQALIADLADGADFAALAREHSTGPSAAAGGDLGWFGDGDMVGEFFDAVAALEPGEVSAPVKTQFGWHVIKLLETRDRERPAFEAVRSELEEQLRAKMLSARIDELTAAARIDRADTSGLDPAVINDRNLLEE